MTVYENPDWLALKAGIIDEPDNDLRRLIVADWLTENGEDDYGEFIRLQCDADTVESSREVDLGHANRLDWFDAGAGTRLRIVSESPLVTIPTAISGDWPEFRVRRGFLDELHAPAGAWVWGGECVWCEGSGNRWGGGSALGGPCPACDGVGHTPAHGYEVIRSHPVTRVVVTDAIRPTATWGWGGPHDFQYMPGDVWERFTATDEGYPFETQKLATDALSAAVIEAARSTTNRQEAAS